MGGRGIRGRNGVGGGSEVRVRVRVMMRFMVGVSDEERGSRARLGRKR